MVERVFYGIPHKAGLFHDEPHVAHTAINEKTDDNYVKVV